ncbi:MAG: heme-binding protein [Gammaproteobacteria bacterium]|nr:heme-binding protein [Gammaproteobacteria bacterium]
MKKILFGGITFLLSLASLPALAEQPVTVPIQRLSLDTAIKAAQAAIAECRKQGVQVAVTIVDRGGHPQVVLRDVLAMDLTLPISRDKAYTALSFNTPTAGLIERLEHANSIGKIDGVIASQGGLPVTAAGTLLGGIGVSGAPSGITDEKCAQAGINAIAADLEMADF